MEPRIFGKKTIGTETLKGDGTDVCVTEQKFFSPQLDKRNSWRDFCLSYVFFCLRGFLRFRGFVRF